MGQLTSKETARPSKEAARLNEINAESFRTTELLDDTLYELAAAEEAAGKPATPGSYQARRDAVWDYSMRLCDEFNAIQARLSECLCVSSVLHCHRAALSAGVQQHLHPYMPHVPHQLPARPRCCCSCQARGSPPAHARPHASAAPAAAA